MSANGVLKREMMERADYDTRVITSGLPRQSVGMGILLSVATTHMEKKSQDDTETSALKISGQVAVWTALGGAICS